jgi:hypothetical protein
MPAKEDNSLRVSFHASPAVTTAFLEMFDVVAAQANKGFDIL